jgi:hypothetical protein
MRSNCIFVLQLVDSSPPASEQRTLPQGLGTAVGFSATRSELRSAATGAITGHRELPVFSVDPWR